MSEIQLQSQAFTELWNKYPHTRGRVFAINNNSQNRTKGAMNKALGVIAGVSDMCLLIEGSVVWIEWKFESGKQSKEQINFQSLVESLGMTYKIIRTKEEFFELIFHYLSREFIIHN